MQTTTVKPTPSATSEAKKMIASAKKEAEAIIAQARKDGESQASSLLQVRGSVF